MQFECATSTPLFPVAKFERLQVESRARRDFSSFDFCMFSTLAGCSSCPRSSVLVVGGGRGGLKASASLMIISS